MSSTQYDDAILDSNAIDPTDKNGNPIPVTIPIMLAPGIKVVYTTRLGGTSEGDFAHFNLGGKSGDKPEHVLANRKALADVLGAKISLISQVHSGRGGRGRIIRHQPAVRIRRVRHEEAGRRDGRRKQRDGE